MIYRGAFRQDPGTPQAPILPIVKTHFTRETEVKVMFDGLSTLLVTIPGLFLAGAFTTTVGILLVQRLRS